MNSINSDNLRKAINKFNAANILVIGDIIVDHFIWGSVDRISPEAPVPVVNVTDENLLLGGGANVLHNLYALGAKAAICGIIGDDAMGDHFIDLLAELASPATGVIRSANRPTTLKTRIIARSQQVVRFDREKTGGASEKTYQAILKFLDNHLHNYDVVIVSDYAKGMISAPLMDYLRTKIKGNTAIPVVVDPKPRMFERFRGVSIITPNQHEAELMSNMIIDSDESLVEAADILQKKLDCDAVLITRGEAGMALLEKNKPIYTIPTVAKEVYDVTGAGDTVIATLALALAVGLTYKEAAVLANFAAGIVVGKIGTATAGGAELMAAVK